MIVALVGVAILAVAVTGALWLSRRSAPARQGQPKVLLFLLYFWMMVFVQLIVVALGYWLLNLK